MNQTTDPHPSIAIDFIADEIEPAADVVPEGSVTFQLMNQTDEPHGFALLQTDHEEPAWGPLTEPVTEGDLNVAVIVPDIPSHDGRAMTVDLAAGRYVMISNTPGDRFGSSLLGLTVQPLK